MITVYATSKEGDGHVSVIGVYDTWYQFSQEFSVRVGIFSPDVVISFEESKDEND